jgi:hypothetical protein
MILVSQLLGLVDDVLRALTKDRVVGSRSRG